METKNNNSSTVKKCKGVIFAVETRLAIWNYKTREKFEQMVLEKVVLEKGWGQAGLLPGKLLMG